MAAARTGAAAKKQSGKAQAMEFGWNELLDKELAQLTEISAKKLPGYLRTNHKETTATDRDMKSLLLECPVTTLRKPTAIMENELPLMRRDLITDRNSKKADQRVLRRLRRKCRVRDHEDVEALAEMYKERGQEVLTDPAELKGYTPRGLASDFFGNLRAQRPFQMQKPSEHAPSLPHSFRFDGTYGNAPEAALTGRGSAGSSSSNSMGAALAASPRGR